MSKDTSKGKHTKSIVNETQEMEEGLLSQSSHEELIKQLNEAEAKANEYWERILRMQAEADNLHRRAKLDLEDARKYEIKKFVTELLPIIDSLELSIVNVPAHLDEAQNVILEGVQLTLKMFYSAMEKFGIKQVNPISEPFNPEFEQAISTEINPSVAPNTVVSVLQKGYTLNNRLIRPALVVVAKDRE